MPGAYTALPAADTSPDVPPGWNPLWPFPGVYPPGYEADLSMVMTAPSELLCDGTASVTGSLRDHETYVTLEPEGNLTSWTAKNGAGEIVRLRLSGGSTYFNSRTTALSFGSEYWGTDAEFEFELTSDDSGDVVTLTATSVISGETVIQSEDIDIILALVYTARVNLTCSTDSDDYAIGRVYAPWSSPEVGYIYTDVSGLWSVDSFGGGAFTLTDVSPPTGYVDIDSSDWDALLGVTIDLYAILRGSDGRFSTITASFLLYENGELVATYNKITTATVPGGDPDGVQSKREAWLTINSDSVTIL